MALGQRNVRVEGPSMEGVSTGFVKEHSVSFEEQVIEEFRRVIPRGY